MINQPPDPVEEQRRSRTEESGVKGLSLTLYANGYRVPVDTCEVKEQSDGFSYKVIFSTTKNALLVGNAANPQLETMWGGVKTDDIKHVRQPKGDGKYFPQAGTVKVIDIIVPENEGGEVQFRCRAMTDIYDWRKDGTLFANAGEDTLIPLSWIQEK
jgi:hypothetical protein